MTAERMSLFLGERMVLTPDGLLRLFRDGTEVARAGPLPPDCWWRWLINGQGELEVRVDYPGGPVLWTPGMTVPGRGNRADAATPGRGNRADAATGTEPS